MSGVYPIWYLVNYNERLCDMLMMFALRFNPSTFGILVSAASLLGGSLTFAQKLPCYFNSFFGNSVNHNV